jgi:hypothetical protein
LAQVAAWTQAKEGAVTQIKQDTSKVHLVDDDTRALCGTERMDSTVELASWQAGFTPAVLGARICRDCEEKAGMGARFEPGEKADDGANWKALDS